MEYRKELLKGNTTVLLLSLLIREPMYGYQIIKDLDARSNGYFRFKEGTLYPALHRMERDGLVASSWEKSSTGLERRYYRVTDKGKEAYEKRVAEWRGFSRAINSVAEVGLA